VRLLGGVGPKADWLLRQQRDGDKLPRYGSAYTFSYATFGELIAWIIGWDLALEFTIGSAALATSFSGYFQEVVDGTFLEVPASLGSAADGVIDLPAVVISLLVMGVLIAGIKPSSMQNQVVVAIKLLVVGAVIVL
jgi:APA family basic amino acid/polyamine antiporter